MFIALITLTVALLAYVQGRSTLPLFIGKHAESPAYRLLLELLLGNAWVSVEGLLLADIGYFSAGRMVALGLLVCAAAVAARRWRQRESTKFPYGTGDAVGMAILIAAYLWAAPAFDTSLFGADSSMYLASGIHISTHGGIAFHDPAVAALSPAQRALLFPSYVRGGHTPPFLRTPGGLLMPRLSDDLVLPAFHPLFSVWVGLFYGLGGDRALAAAITYFAALSIWALVVFASELGGVGAAAFAAALLAVMAPQHWYSRFPMPEVPSQYFLWAGLVAGVWSFRSPRTWIGALAGIGVGVACLMRLDNLAHILAGLALWKAFAPSSSWPAGRGFTAAFAVLAAYAVLHQLWFPTHYLTEIRRNLLGARLILEAHPWAWLLTAGVAAATVFFGLRAGLAGRRRWGALGLRLGALGCLLAYAAISFLEPTASVATQLQWIIKYLSWPVLVAAGVGLALWPAFACNPAQRFVPALGLLVGASLVCDPRVTPAALWGIRRFLPIALPVAIVAAALALEQLRRRAPRLVTLAALAGVLGPLLPRFASTYALPAYRGGIEYTRAIGALIPPGSIVVGDPSLFVPSQLHVALWATRDVEPFVLGSRMTRSLLVLTQALRGRRIFWMGPADQPPADIDHLQFEPVATYQFSIGMRFMEPYEERDDFSFRQVALGIYELR